MASTTPAEGLVRYSVEEAHDNHPHRCLVRRQDGWSGDGWAPRCEFWTYVQDPRWAGGAPRPGQEPVSCAVYEGQGGFHRSVVCALPRDPPPGSQEAWQLSMHFIARPVFVSTAYAC